MRELTKRAPKYSLKELKVELTYRCNLQCVHCSSEGSLDMVEAISWPEMFRILESASRMGVERISLSGGEPFVWPDFRTLLLSSELNEFAVKIYTSGTSDNFRELCEVITHKNLKFIFSMYSASHEVHEKVTKVSDSYRKTLASLEYINGKFDTEVHFVPLSVNYNQLKPLVALLSKIGVQKLSVLRFVPQGRGAINKHLDLSQAQNLKLREDIKEIRQSGYNIRTGSPFNFLFLNDQPQCTSGIDKLIIAPDLSIYPCDAFKQISLQQIGIKDEYSSLKRYSLEECWSNSKYIQKIRTAVTSKVNKLCYSCDKYDMCKSGCIAQRVLRFNTLDSMRDPSCLMKQND